MDNYNMEGEDEMSHVLVAKERTDFKQSTLRQLRENGEIPAVVYGNENSSKAISVNQADLRQALKEIGRNGIILLDCQGEQYQVMLSQISKGSCKA